MNQDAKIGRPKVIDEEIVGKLESAFRDGLTVTEACLISGISRSTFYDELNSNEDFSDRIGRSQIYVITRAKKVVVSAIDGGDLKAAQWFLERKAKEEFGSVSEVKNDLSSNDNRAEIRQLTDEMIKAVNIQEENRRLLLELKQKSTEIPQGIEERIMNY